MTEAGQSRKFLLHDNTSAHIFTLTITHLELEDKGTYWCVRRGNSSSDIYRTKIHLDIKPELTCELGQNVSIQCHYNQELRSSVKFLCKELNSSDCAEGGVKITSADPQTDRVSLSDDASAGVFTVTIAGLKEEDSGTYWCGGSTGLEHVLISSVDLDIFQDAESSHDSSTPMKPKKVTTKTQLDNTTNSVTSVVLILPPPSSESGNFVLSISSVAVGILLFGVILYSFLRWTRKKRDRGSSAEVKEGDNTRTTRRLKTSKIIQTLTIKHPLFTRLLNYPQTH
ncbi:CMRF35-like molecule 6 isoform X2 [Colossoma macropomum]|uniref:CMRF35-like molecule 6 isoform X2 n=1 Tax=Colossoma macropomum TaxID=42526 RepID=UPI001863AEF9|nr:CMRF35-like molecule 6 isoform X2 [Colossoma macropomum]